MVQLRVRVAKRPDFAKLGLSTQGVDDLLAEIALEVEREAKRRAPVDTGRLRSSISTFKDGPLQHGVVANVEYGAFLEFGTGRLGAGTDPGPTPPDYVHGPRIGMVAQPFLRPALEVVRGRVADMLRRR